MRQWKRHILKLALVLIPVQMAMAIEIPLEGAQGGTGGRVSIGYVDMEKIFQLYPETQTAKEDYAKQLNARKQDLAKREAELQTVKNRISVLQSAVKEYKSPDSSTEPVTGIDPDKPAVQPAQPQNLDALKKELDDKQAEYEEARKRAQDELINFEKRQSQVILGKLYQALQDLAEEEQVTIVVDKSSILYGAANIDLTDKLQARVRGY